MQNNIETGQIVKPATSVRTGCPECQGRLALPRIIGGRAGSEYWTQRCTRCGTIHLDIVRPLAN